MSLAKLEFPSICTFLGSLGRYFFNKLGTEVIPPLDFFRKKIYYINKG